MWMVARNIGHCVESPGFSVFSYLPPCQALKFFSGNCGFNLSTQNGICLLLSQKCFLSVNIMAMGKTKFMLNGHN